MRSWQGSEIVVIQFRPDAIKKSTQFTSCVLKTGAGAFLLDAERKLVSWEKYKRQTYTNILF